MVLNDIKVKPVKEPGFLERIFGKKSHLCDICNEEHPDQEVTAKFKTLFNYSTSPSTTETYYLHASCADKKIERLTDHQSRAQLYFNAYRKSPKNPLLGMPGGPLPGYSG